MNPTIGQRTTKITPVLPVDDRCSSHHEDEHKRDPLEAQISDSEPSDKWKVTKTEELSHMTFTWDLKMTLQGEYNTTGATVVHP